MFNKSNLYIYIWERKVNRSSFNDRVRIGGCEIGLAVLVEWTSNQETKRRKEKGKEQVLKIDWLARLSKTSEQP